MSHLIQVRANRSATPAPATEFRRGNAVKGERMVASNGETNAWSRKDLFANNMEIMASHQRGQLITDADFSFQDQLRDNKTLLMAALNDTGTFEVLGQKMADALYVAQNRQGFLRKILARQALEQGQIPRAVLRGKNVTAVYSTSPTDIESQIVRDNWYYPPEFDIVARPFVPQKELNQSADDVLTEKFVEGQEALMVAEDRLLISAANAVVGMDNELTALGTAMTPWSFMQVVDKVQRWGLSPAAALLASDLLKDIVGNSEWQNALDPVAKHELLLTGQLGVLYGTSIITDAYRHPQHKVLNRGEFYIFADPENTGMYTDRNGLQSLPTDVTNEKKVGRGWVIWEAFSMCLANTRAVAKGIRLG